MKYIKTYENKNSEPKIGDYVIIKTNHKDPRLINFFKNSVGKILNIKTEKAWGTNPLYETKFIDEIPEELSNIWDSPFRNKNWKTATHWVGIENIVHFSKNKEDLEPYIISNKYNL